MQEMINSWLTDIETSTKSRNSSVMGLNNIGNAINSCRGFPRKHMPGRNACLVHSEQQLPFGNRLIKFENSFALFVSV